MSLDSFSHALGLTELAQKNSLGTSPLSPDNPQSKLLVGLFKNFLIVTTSVSGVYILVSLALDPQLSRLILPALVLVVNLVCAMNLRKGRIHSAFKGYVWFMFIAIAIQSAIRGGLHEPSLAATVLLFLIGGWLLGGKQALFLWLAAICWMGVLTLNSHFNWWTPLMDGSAPQRFFALTTVWTASFLVARLMSNSYHQYVHNIQELNASLSEKLSALAEQRESIRKSEQRVTQILAASPLPLTVANFQTGVYVEVNRSWESTFHFEKAEIVGKTSMDLGFWKDTKERQGWIDRFSKDGRISGYEATFRLRDGTERTFLLSSERFMYGGEESVLTMSMDMTERKILESELKELNSRLEDRVARRTEALHESNQHLQTTMANLQRAQSELIQSEKLASLGSLVAGVAHELNTPLGNALLSATTMTTEIEDLKKAVAQGDLKKSAFDAFLKRVTVGLNLTHRSLQRSVELISSFKQVAVDMESERRRSFELADTLKEVLDTLTPTIKRTNVTFEIHCPPGITLESFPGPLGQVIINLVTNSLAHAFEGREAGHIRILVGYVEGKKAVTLSIEDDGTGIPPENLSQIFDPFFTTKLGKGGSGLGLSISQRIVTKILGGSIRVSAKQSKGACFELLIPVVAPHVVG